MLYYTKLLYTFEALKALNIEALKLLGDTRYSTAQ